MAFPSGVDGGTEGSTSASRLEKEWQDGDAMKQLHGTEASGSAAAPAAAANMPLAGCSHAAGGGEQCRVGRRHGEPKITWQHAHQVALAISTPCPQCAA